MYKSSAYKKTMIIIFSLATLLLPLLNINNVLSLTIAITEKYRSSCMEMFIGIGIISSGILTIVINYNILKVLYEVSRSRVESIDIYIHYICAGFISAMINVSLQILMFDRNAFLVKEIVFYLVFLLVLYIYKRRYHLNYRQVLIISSFCLINVIFMISIYIGRINV